MIVAEGRRFIKRYLAGQAGTMVGAMSVGIGNTAPTLNDERMEFEITRVPVVVTDYDFFGDELVFKCTLSEDVGCTIYEAGLWTAEANTGLGSQENRLLTSFDSESETWDPATFDTSAARIGADSLKLTPAASQTNTSTMGGLALDLGEYSAEDAFILAYNVSNSNTANVKVRLRTDEANYYEFTINAPTIGYKFATLRKGAALVTGVPNWSDIGDIQVSVTATSGGSASVNFEGLRLEDMDSTSTDYGLVARTVLATPIVKREGTVLDFEYGLKVNIS